MIQVRFKPGSRAVADKIEEALDFQYAYTWDKNKEEFIITVDEEEAFTMGVELSRVKYEEDRKYLIHNDFLPFLRDAIAKNFSKDFVISKSKIKDMWRVEVKPCSIENLKSVFTSYGRLLQRSKI